MKDLQTGELNAPNTVTFSDERERAPLKAPAGAVASVTLEGRESSWGEFLTLEEVAVLRAWCDGLLSEALK